MSRSAGSDDRGYADFAAHKKPGRPKRGWRHPETAKRLARVRGVCRAISGASIESNDALALTAALLSREAELIRKASENEEYLKGLDR